MGRHIAAPYGHRTWAMLDKCSRCRRPFNGDYGWRTLRHDDGKDHVVTVMCGECHARAKGFFK